MYRSKLIAAAAMCAICLLTIHDVRADISNSAVLFLRIAPNARAAAMGDAYVAIADDANATHWNPAGLASSGLQGSWKTTRVPDELQPVKGFAALRKDGGTLEGYEVWAITNKGLARLGKNWETGETFSMRTDETVSGKVSAYFNLTDPAEVRAATRLVAQANSRESYESLAQLLEAIRAAVPDAYSHRGEMLAEVDSTLLAYDECRVNWDRVAELRDQFNSGYKDSSLTESELDKLGFTLERSVTRFVPEQIIIPYSAITSAELTDIEADQSVMLVGTTNGLLKYNGRNWQRLSGNDGIRSSNILDLQRVGPTILVATDSGLSRWGGLTFDTLKATNPLPGGAVDAVGGTSPTDIFAAVNGDLYHYDGTTWSNTRSYTITVGDTPERLAGRFSLYKTDSDLKYFMAKMEAAGLPQLMVQPDSGQQAPEGAAAPGATIQLPYVGKIIGRVNTIHIDDDGEMFIGTELGLAILTDTGWVLPGYALTTIGDSTVIDSLLPRSVSSETELAAAVARFRKVNGLADDAPLSSGTIVLAATNKLSAPVDQIVQSDQTIYANTSLGLTQYRDGLWSDASMGGMTGGDDVAFVQTGEKTWFSQEGKLNSRTPGGTSLAFTYVKWLPELAPDLYYSFLGFAKGTSFGTIGGNITFISYGTITRTREESATPVGTFESFDIAGTVSWGIALNQRTRFGISAKVIHSRLSDQGAGAEQGQGTSTGFAVDLGLLHSFSSRLQLGLAVTNLGPQMAYIDAAQADDLPRNLALGFAYKIIDAEDTRLLVTAEMNKILVGLDDGFSGELKEAIFNGGAEFEFLDLIAFRGGYIYDQDGQVKTPTFGVGLRPIKPVRFDVSYIPSDSDVALANTLRWSAAFNL